LNLVWLNQPSAGAAGVTSSASSELPLNFAALSAANQGCCGGGMTTLWIGVQPISTFIYIFKFGSSFHLL
jgi:hypothetical protein